MKKLPPLPKFLHSVLGPVQVEQVPELHTVDGDKAFGLWHPGARKIQVATAGVVPTIQWLTLEHERVHQQLFDGGVSMIDKRDLEHICDVIAAARVAEMLSR